MRTLTLFTLSIALLLHTGCCGDGRLATIKVTGTVTYNGQPLEGANVTFTPQTEGEGHPAYGRTDADGRYTLQTQLGNPEAGTTAGEYLVSITKREAVADMGGEGQGPAPPARSLIPERYGSFASSGLTATVARGNSVFDFDLTP
ncbi:MAG: carboxypeptidase-like regulatory domain-containing protein [Planctomycetaceae bacterium]|nr:carboxypeptidase-like regulatory domain-containing protein [Planctomycetaceae bacterium]